MIQEVVADFIDQLQLDFNKTQPIFPTFLCISLEIKKQLDNPDFSLDHLVPVIQMEPVLSAKIMGLANSAFYNTSSKTLKDLKSAVMRLGTTIIKTVAFTVSAQQLAKSEELRPVQKEIQQLWMHTAGTIGWALTLAELSPRKQNADEILFACVVQEIGKLCVISKAGKYLSLVGDHRAFMDIVQTWHKYASSRVLQAMGIDPEVIIAPVDSKFFAGNVPPATVPDIVAAATILTTEVNPFSTADHEVFEFIRQNLASRFENFDELQTRALTERQRMLSILGQG